MILKSEPAPIHNPEDCKTCKTEVCQDIFSILHAAEGTGMVPAMLCLVHEESGEIMFYTCNEVDSDELISALAKTVASKDPLSGKEGGLHLTAIRSGEHGN